MIGFPDITQDCALVTLRFGTCCNCNTNLDNQPAYIFALLQLEEPHDFLVSFCPRCALGLGRISPERYTRDEPKFANSRGRREALAGHQG